MILHGDCLDRLKKLKDNSVDSIVTDPPYGLSFMGKKWDYEVPSIEIWRECLRVLKPGGHLLSFAGTRTYHRMACNIEDAGFEIRDQIMWLYGSGFPKSHDISKAIDKAAGAEREVTPTIVMQKKSDVGEISKNKRCAVCGKARASGNPCTCPRLENIPATESAKQWQGWGTALKPANEPIVVARKPLEKGLTVAQNVLKYGTGALNIDASRIETSTDELKELNRPNKRPGDGASGFMTSKSRDFTPSQGRWPANVLLDEEAAATLPIIQGESVSRYFYVAKASKRERGEGNVHPTVKPVKLMEYLIKLVTPPNGVVLDPFMGSGTTGVAAKKLKCKFIGIERELEYKKIAEKRIEVCA